MTAPLTIPEYDRLTGRVRSAWVQLNQAGDTPDSRRSILCLQSAIHHLLATDEALSGASTLEEMAARRHHSFRSRHMDAAGLLRQLSERAQEIHRDPKAVSENVPDALLVHSVIPVIWRLIRSLRHDVRARRPLSYYSRLTRRFLRLAIMVAAAWVLLHLLWFASPWGGRIAYYATQDLESFRGWGLAPSLSRDYGMGRPLPWMRRDSWSARWTGVLQVPENADYSFYAQCAGGMRLWIDEELLVDNWRSPGWTRGIHAQRTLEAGRHPVRMEFQDRGGKSAVRVRWTGGPIPPNTAIGFPHLRTY